MEQNPLTAAAVCSSSNGYANKKGRPPKGNAILFGPQPQSMVSKLLNQVKADCIKTVTECEDETITLTSTPSCEPESDQTGDDINTHKRKIKTKTESTKPKVYSCDFEDCSYSTKLASNMTKHKRIHTGEKPYLCDRCSFRSNFVNSLKSHKRLHTEERPYKCSECTFIFNSISNLKKHCRARHKT